ncbi:uncharacterized protein LTHEOB_5376 [Lasiodiplodia theobromae]|uniref:Negative regulator of differentiation 1 n=1 Tax=Lasiodiplodia theobromae TaxID=45133 RepID=A0A5N5DQ41_9PEZI|nr:uncharacterized protein LTHEOB_5376 [Lasiodiplodia theobromae]KAB2580078.1 hypothetical protein DBV05_g1345 [Lasiodiplodia theobromae]KAF4544965.1 hypothetical protein LTHEOB_5376 [Lasiodiplodia theobromae]
MEQQAAACGDTLEIDAEYLRFLVTHAHATRPLDPFDSSMVRIRGIEYDFLKRSLTDYLTLRKNMLDYGIKPTILEAFLNPDGFDAHSNTTQRPSGFGAGISMPESMEHPVPSSFDHVTHILTGNPVMNETALRPNERWYDSVTASEAEAGFNATPEVFTTHNPEAPVFRMPEQSESEYDLPVTGGSNDYGREYNVEHDTSSRPGHISLNDKRTIEITGFSPATSLKEVVAHVKGGMIVEAYRCNDRVVRLSFLHGVDAEAFYTYAKRNDMYINNKRVAVNWSGRQWTISPFIESKIMHGATRVLRLHEACRYLTEQNIRLDMDHIDNLIILDIKAQGNDLVVYTNSVQLCGFARSCMMSRKPYKSLKIGFERDDCDEPLPQRVRPNYANPARPSSQHTFQPRASGNFYDVLDLEPTEDEEDDNSLWQTGRHDRASSDFSSVIYEARQDDSDPIHID